MYFLHLSKDRLDNFTGSMLGNAEEPVSMIVNKIFKTCFRSSRVVMGPRVIRVSSLSLASFSFFSDFERFPFVTLRSMNDTAISKS